MTDLTTPRAPERAAPAPDDRPPVAPPVFPGAAVELTRLLALARLTAPQAIELGAGLLAAVAERAADGPGLHDFHPALTPEGRVVLVPHPAGAGGSSQAGLLAEIETAAGLPAADLQEAAARIDRPAALAELAALAAAVGALPGGVGGGTGVPLPPAGRAPRAAPPAARPARRPRSTGRRIGAWLLSLVVLGAVVAAEVVFLGDDITTDIDLLLDAGRGEEEPEPDGLPVIAPAPPSAGDVAAVDLRPLDRCDPGSPCRLRLLVRLAPSPEPRTVTWSYRVVDRCTGASTTVPGGTLAVPPSADRAAVVGEVVLPPLPGVAVLAVTETPAAAASAPVSAGSCRPAAPGA